MYNIWYYLAGTIQYNLCRYLQFTTEGRSSFLWATALPLPSYASLLLFIIKGYPNNSPALSTLAKLLICSKKQNEIDNTKKKDSQFFYCSTIKIQIYQFQFIKHHFKNLKNENTNLYYRRPFGKFVDYVRIHWYLHFLWRYEYKWSNFLKRLLKL